MRAVLGLLTTVSWLSVPLATAAPPESGAVEIPLEEIWALDTPGAQDIRSLDSADDPIVETALKQAAESKDRDHSYVVRGEGVEALREFLRVRNNPDFWNRLPADQPLSIVFYTNAIPKDVDLEAVERTGNTFRLHFRFAPLHANEATLHLGVIPIGKLPVGNYFVTPARAQAEQGVVRPEPSPQLLVGGISGCSFHVVAGPGGSPPPPQLVEIPLTDIWAYRMPGTRDMNEFNEPGSKDPFVDKVLLQIRNSWHHRSGMAVQGEGRDALDNLYRVRTERLPHNTVKANSPISLAIFTRGTKGIVYLDNVRRLGNEFTIQYRFAPTHAQETGSTIALIPVGQLEAGMYKVSLERLPLEQEYRDRGFREPPREWINNICSSFSFSVDRPR